MFEVAEIGHEVSKRSYEERADDLRIALLKAQLTLVEKKPFPVVIIVSGVEGAGKGEIVHLINQWMDPRHVETHAIGKVRKQEHDRPAMWRFWMSLPPKGKVGLFFGSWYTTPIFDRAYRKMRRSEFDATLDQIVRFEKMLTDEGVVLVKIWLHLSKDAQGSVLRQLEKKRATRWRVSPSDWENHAQYRCFKQSGGEALRRTSTGNAPWIVVDASDPRHRNLAVGEAVKSAIERGLGTPRVVPPVTAAPLAATDRTNILESLDYTQTIEKSTYRELLAERQGELNELSRLLKERGRSLTVACEGFDAAGKGGAIRRVAQALDARHYSVIPIAAPTEEERARPYLWRFWRHIPAIGAITIFDRSWYGRVLVERVEGLCAEGEYLRAYSEINDFEEQLAAHGSMLVKFFVSVTKDEQLRRFEQRKQNEQKSWKLTDEDWRNREKWDLYQTAVTDMVERTSTTDAPWTLIEGNDKSFARIKVLDTLIERMKGELTS